MLKGRFKFWRLFWILAGIYLFFFILAVIIILTTPEKVIALPHLFTISYTLGQLASFLFSLLFFYYTLNAYYPLLANRRPFVDFIKPSVIAIIFTGIYHLITFRFSDKMKVTIGVNASLSSPNELPVALLVVVSLISCLLFIGMALLIAYLTFLRDEKKKQKVLEEQKMQLEVEKSQANFNFLKAQINPHFLHNTLNFLYAKSLPYSPELSEGILTLSDIMRYALSEGNAKDGKAPLKDEIEHMRNVIKINQLRFSNKLNVEFDVEGVVNGAMIIPFVLITLVENAFKHGDLKSTEEPIDIRLKINGDRLHFYCRNKKKTGPKEISTGIGLDNIKKRLDLAYGNNYALNIKDEADFYTTELFIHHL